MKKRHSTTKWKGLLFAMLWTISLGMFAQNITISGNVKDDTGLEVIGATIIVEGNATIGTTTDVDGNYVLNNVPSNGNLVFSYVGMKSQTVAVNGRSRIDVTMASDTELLDEVIVVGYGTQKKVNLTGAVGTADKKVLENRPITNLGQGLQGVIPNLQVNQSSYSPGKGSSFNIRGTTSLNGGSPLVLVDGVVQDPNLINPNDVESVSVLKDAASASIY